MFDQRVAMVGWVIAVILVGAFLATQVLKLGAPEPIPIPIDTTTNPPVVNPPVTPPPITPPATGGAIPGTRLLVSDVPTPTTSSGPACPGGSGRGLTAYTGNGATMLAAAQSALAACASDRTTCATPSAHPCTITFCISTITSASSSTSKQQCNYNTTQPNFLVANDGTPTQLGSGSCTTINTGNVAGIRSAGAMQSDGWTCGAALKV
jgi:hypothetical protein